VADKPLATFKQRIRQLTRRSGGRSMAEGHRALRPYLLGWKAYFGLAQTPNRLARAGRVAAAPAAGDPAQALEARHDDLPGTETLGAAERMARRVAQTPLLVAEQPMVTSNGC
jgi:RNA-directed DNA polymerase